MNLSSPCKERLDHQCSGYHVDRLSCPSRSDGRNRAHEPNASRHVELIRRPAANRQSRFHPYRCFQELNVLRRRAIRDVAFPILPSILAALDTGLRIGDLAQVIVVFAVPESRISPHSLFATQ